MDQEYAVSERQASKSIVTIRAKWLVAMGDRCRTRRDWPGAARNYRQALQVNPHMRPIWVQLGHALKEAGSLDEALECYRFACRLPGGDGDAPFHQALLARRLGKGLEAAVALVQAIDENPDNREYHCELLRLDVPLFDAAFYQHAESSKTGQTGAGLLRMARTRLPAPGSDLFATAILRSLKDDIEDVLRSDLFDAEWYLERYPDVEAAGVDPLAHFMLYGWQQLRDPNSLFSTQWYLQSYQDAAAHVINPLVHYVRHGFLDRRDTGPTFRPSIFQDPKASHGSHHLAAAHRFLRAIDLENNGGKDRVISSPPRVLIIAELSIPQCRKYRVDQKAELLQRLGCGSTIIDWHDESACIDAISLHSLVIFYRVPASDNVLRYIRLAKARGMPTFWEVDDLIFDPNAYLENASLKTLTPQLQFSVLSGVPPYRAAMLACDQAIASTGILAKAMVDAGVGNVHLVENALDADTIEAAEHAVANARRPDSRIRIVYGSGTSTHDKDFLEAAPAILACFKAHPMVRLRIIGELGLPDTFADFSDRIERFPVTSYRKYLTLAAEGDIAIAPLEPTLFNDAKSNIKFIEAAMIGLPTVCSPRAEFAGIVKHGRNGLLADNSAEWYSALESLILDPQARHAMAASAKAAVFARYDPQVIADEQLALMIRPYQLPRKALRVLSVNVFYSPRSFGGATIVAEQMGRLLNERDDTEVFVFTTCPSGTAQPYRILQYDADGIPVFALNIPEVSNLQLDFDTPYTGHAFREVLQLVRPDVVNFHSIQTLGAQLLEICEQENVPSVVTLHDAWWICGRQFMIKADGGYCFQTRVDMNVCAGCVNDAGANLYRQFRLRDMLDRAQLLLAPSTFFHGIYAANGFAADRLKVNRNGVGRPVGFKHKESAKLRFGFVGGNSPLKGAKLIREVFGRLDRTDYELVLVDNLVSLGFNSVRADDWPISGTLRILPSYTQETMDAFYAQIDVLLFPTQWKESFGLTVREALMRDVWVIATDAGGVVEDIVDTENGDIIPLLDDGTALHQAVVRALENKDAIKRHVNPHKAKVFDHARQALELHQYLAEVARKKVFSKSVRPMKSVNRMKFAENVAR